MSLLKAGQFENSFLIWSGLLTMVIGGCLLFQKHHLKIKQNAEENAFIFIIIFSIVGQVFLMIGVISLLTVWFYGGIAINESLFDLLRFIIIGILLIMTVVFLINRKFKSLCLILYPLSAYIALLLTC